MKKTKIICTIGNKYKEINFLKKLLKNGMNIMRINLSHINSKNIMLPINNLLLAKKETNINAGILLDTKGPEIRTLSNKNNIPIFINKNKSFILNLDKNIESNNKIISIDYPNIINIIKLNDIILIDDGLLSFKVKEINVSKNKIICKALNDGYLGSCKGVNLPNININLPILSESDKLSIIKAINYKIEFIALSFVRNINDILYVKKFISSININNNIKIIAKIENLLSLNNIEEIICNCDGIMIARGDLGVELPLEKITLIQKEIINKCNKKGKIVITATQMLESMINNPNPTRAEISDISNAILDGTDAIMLSAETAIGKYPIETLKMMTKICNEIDIKNNLFIKNKKNKILNKNNLFIKNICFSIINILNNNYINLVIVITNDIQYYLFLKLFNKNNNILFITNNKNIINLILLTRGMYSYYIEKDKINDLDKIYNLIIDINLIYKWIIKNNFYILYIDKNYYFRNYDNFIIKQIN